MGLGAALEIFLSVPGFPLDALEIFHSNPLFAAKSAVPSHQKEAESSTNTADRNEVRGLMCPEK